MLLGHRSKTHLKVVSPCHFSSHILGFEKAKQVQLLASRKCGGTVEKKEVERYGEEKKKQGRRKKLGREVGRREGETHLHTTPANKTIVGASELPLHHCRHIYTPLLSSSLSPFTHNTHPQNTSRYIIQYRVFILSISVMMCKLSLTHTHTNLSWCLHINRLLTDIRERKTGRKEEWKL